jgi:cobalt-precorrin-5B (C1)-methyltransferase
VRFPIEWDGEGRAVVVKDAGDDPDCTDGARMTAEVRWADSGDERVLRAGEGVGTITKLGLGLTLGAPAINPVPRRMILAALGEVGPEPVVVTFSMPDGEAMAAETTNARLGISGGISILGTSGIVRPFSTASYRASVVQQIDVAAAQGERTVVLATGARSEAAAARLYPGLDSVCLVEVGDFTGIALRRAAHVGMRQVIFAGMAGKLAKLAAGVMMTHFHRSAVDTGFLAEIAATTGAPASVVQGAGETATARHFFELCEAAGVRAPLERLCTLARANCIAHAGGAFGCSVTMVDFDGAEVVARAA